MSHGAKGFRREVYAAGISHVTRLLRRVDDAWTGEAPISSRGKRHGGINESIAELRRDQGGKVMRDEHMLAKRHTGAVLFHACGVINRCGFAGGNCGTH